MGDSSLFTHIIVCHLDMDATRKQCETMKVVGRYIYLCVKLRQSEKPRGDENYLMNPIQPKEES